MTRCVTVAGRIEFDQDHLRMKGRRIMCPMTRMESTSDDNETWLRTYLFFSVPAFSFEYTRAPHTHTHMHIYQTCLDWIVMNIIIYDRYNEQTFSSFFFLYGKLVKAGESFKEWNPKTKNKKKNRNETKKKKLGTYLIQVIMYCLLTSISNSLQTRRTGIWTEKNKTLRNFPFLTSID